MHGEPNSKEDLLLEMHNCFAIDGECKNVVPRSKSSCFKFVYLLGEKGTTYTRLDFVPRDDVTHIFFQTLGGYRGGYYVEISSTVVVKIYRNYSLQLVYETHDFFFVVFFSKK